jgi:hypothetical protein
MTISEATFDDEAELERWTFANSRTFFGDSILVPKFRITTPSGKHGIPDGFVFNFVQRSWWVVECELLAHGVWPHIAEQITRFVVAIRNPNTLRQVRDKLFEEILTRGHAEAIARDLETDSHRLLQQIELFLEGVRPSLAMFIDDTNQDLTDFCNALDISAAIYRVRKIVVNGRTDYYSPDRNLPAVTTEPAENPQEGASTFEVVEQLGGGEVFGGRNKLYRLQDERVVKIKYSKLYERHQAFWYGINPSSYEQAKAAGCTHLVLVMGTYGFVVLPIETVDDFLETAYVTKNPDDTIRHYHVHVTPPPEVILKGYGNGPDVDVAHIFQAFD